MTPAPKELRTQLERPDAPAVGTGQAKGRHRAHCGHRACTRQARVAPRARIPELGARFTFLLRR